MAVSVFSQYKMQKDYIQVQQNGQISLKSIYCQVTGKGLEIIIKNLGSDCQLKLLLKMFSEAGVIQELRMLVTHDNRCRGKAFVKYSSTRQCKTAVLLFNGLKLGNKNIIVEESLEHSSLVFTGIPASVSFAGIEHFFKAKFEGVDTIEEESRNGETLKVNFLSHRAAALARREFTRQKQVIWNSIVRADWPEDTKKQCSSHTYKREAIVLDLSAWKSVDEKYMTPSFWERHGEEFWKQHLKTLGYQNRAINNTKTGME